MENNPFISIYLDTRTAKKDGKHPVKLRVFTSHPRKQKLYTTPYAFTKEEFTSLQETKRPRAEQKKYRLRLKAIEQEANQVAEIVKPFSFEAFERKLFSTSITGNNDVTTYYQRTIDQFNKNNQVSTASLYELSRTSLLAFYGKKKLTFQGITPQWLKAYEKHMVDDNGRSHTTVSMYLRTLRAVFNNAMADKVISTEEYPFGKRRYKVPNPKGTKKALSKEQLKTLFDAKPSTDEQQKAKDFWFFSYVCNGMNFKDITHLKYRNLTEDTLTFMRAKTASTNSDQSPVVVYLADFAKQVISRYGTSDKSQDNYIFSIVNPRAEPSERHRQVKNFVRFVNQHFSKFARSAGINEQVSTYWARHSFATNAIRSGASMEYVSEALSHSSMNTTRGYFAGFDDEKKKEIAKKLMEF